MHEGCIKLRIEKVDPKPQGNRRTTFLCIKEHGCQLQSFRRDMNPCTPCIVYRCLDRQATACLLTVKRMDSRSARIAVSNVVHDANKMSDAVNAS